MALVKIDLNLLDWNLSSSDPGGLFPGQGEQVRVYLRGTTTDAAVWNADRSVPIPQPLTSNGYGEVDGWVDPASYDLAVFFDGVLARLKPWEAVSASDVGATIPVDGAAGVPSLRTLGSAGTQAAPGNDARFGTSIAGSLINDSLIWDGSGWVSKHIGEESLLAPLWIELASRADIPVVPELLNSSLSTLVSGTEYLTYFIPRKTVTITKLGVYVTSNATGSPTLSRLALYTADAAQLATMVAHSANVPTLLTTAGLRDSVLVSNNLDGSAGSWPTSYQLVRGTMYALGYINVGGTAQPNLRGMGVYGNATGRLPYKNIGIAGQTDLGAGPINPASNQSSLLVGGYAE